MAISKGKVNTCEEMEEFTSYCSAKDDYDNCTHPNKIVNQCIKDKKYCPRVAKKDRNAKDQPEWKTNYEVFKAEHDKFFETVIMSDAFVEKLELKYPKYDIRETLKEESIWWSSDKKDKGWDNKRKRDSKTIDWEETYKFAVARAIQKGQATYKNRPSASSSNTTWGKL